MSNRNIQQPGGRGGNVIMGGGDSSGMAYVDAEMLKQVDVPVETLLGATNGAITGGILSAVVSGAVSFGKSKGGKGTFLKEAVKDITTAKGGHLIPVLIGTSVLTALGGIVRCSRAKKHNEWSDRHYAFLTQQQPAADTQVEKVEATRAENQQEKGR